MFFSEENTQPKVSKQHNPKFMRGVKSKTSEAYPFSPSLNVILTDNQFSISKKQTNETEMDFCQPSNGFISSIINKIKSVKRLQPTVDTSPKSALKKNLRQPLQREFSNIASIQQVQQKGAELQDKAKIAQTDQCSLKTISFKSQQLKSNVEQQLMLLKLENLNLKNTITQMNHELQSHKRKCQQLEAQIQFKGSLIVKIETQVAQREAIHADQLQDQCSRIEDLTATNKQLKSLQFRIKQGRSRLNIAKVLDHQIFPVSNQLLLKAQQQILSLKNKIINIEKQSLYNIKHLQKRNCQQIEQMRKNFNKSFHQYKKSIDKKTLKEQQSTKKILEPIIEAGSIHQS